MDLIHIPSIRRIPLIKTCPNVATVHDMAPFTMKNKYDPIRTFYHTYILSFLVHRCDKIITVSHNTKREIIEYTKYPADKISVIYPGVDNKTFQPAKKELAKHHLIQKYKIDFPFIVFISRIEHPAKNHLNLIKAFEIFKQSSKFPHHLILAGVDWYNAEIVKKYAIKSKFHKEIHFLGYLPREDIVQLYSSCDLMFYPSYVEGFGLPIIEAMACGAPVMCSNTNSLKEIANGIAQVFDPTSPEDMAFALERGVGLIIIAT